MTPARKLLQLALCFLIFHSCMSRVCANDSLPQEQAILLLSPNGNVIVSITSPMRRDPALRGPRYSVKYRGRNVVLESRFGLTFLQSGAFHYVRIAEIKRDQHDETYAVVAGKSATARDHYNELTLVLRDGTDNRQINVVFRAYDDGAAFRYVIPQQPGFKEFSIASEDSDFNVPGDATAWVLPIPNFNSHYEYRYQVKRISELEPEKLVGMPLLMQLPDNGPALAITEANLVDYPGMYLLPTRVDESGTSHLVLRSALTPQAGQTQVKVKAATPHMSPWRVFMIGDSASRLIESNLVLNLSEPCAIADTSWIKPGKVCFLWWNGYLVGDNAERGGVDTYTYKQYVDAAAEFGFPYSSIDGVGVSWYGENLPGDGSKDATVPIKRVNMPEILAHAKSKGIRIRLWVATISLSKVLDKALATYEQWGIEGIMVDFVQRDDQQGINWIRELVAKAAQHHLTVTMHNVTIPTGLRRTYPNLLTREAVLNQECNKWSALCTPEHDVTVPFTRMLAGPLDYHAGAFRSVRLEDFRPRDIAPEVMTTRCHELGMYVVYEDPMPMAVDYPSAYRDRPGLDFLVAVPTTWDETRVLNGEVGHYITIARRKGKDWYVGCMTDQNARELKIPLDFLGPGDFTADIWADKASAGPNGVTREKKSVTSSTILTASLIPAGGQAVQIKPD